LRRRREIAMRLALGAGRGRVLRQLLVESLLLAALGGAAGLALAQWGGAGLRLLFLARHGPVGVLTDSRTLLFATVASLAAALLIGVVPALTFRRHDVGGALRPGLREESQRRSPLATGLLVFQATLSVVLLVGAGLFVRSLQNVNALRLGYDVEPLLFATASTRGVELDEGQQRALVARMTSAARSLPGVTGVALVATVPFWSNEGRGLYRSDGEPVAASGPFVLQASTPGYFATLGTRILQGRPFDERDGEGQAPVVVVGDGMARALWPDRDPLGECLRIGEATAACATVIGVAEDVRLRSFGASAEHAYYVPVAQLPDATYPQLLVRFAGDAEPHADALRRRLQAEMPGAAHVGVLPLSDLVAPNLRAWKLGATMFVMFGALALALAAVGLYGLVAYDLAQRRRELAVRLALGALPRHVLRAVVEGALRMVALGVALGVALALLAAPRLEPLLFQESPRDPWVFGVVAATLLAVALLASAAPARRALAVAPSAVLREE
jgi:predicted permease